MPPVGIEPRISAGERPQTYALDRAATGTGNFIVRNYYSSFTLNGESGQLIRQINVMATSLTIRMLPVRDRPALAPAPMGTGDFYPAAKRSSAHQINIQVKVKVKVTLVQALRLCTDRTAHRGSRGIALPFHDHGTRRG